MIRSIITIIIAVMFCFKTLQAQDTSNVPPKKMVKTKIPVSKSTKSIKNAAITLPSGNTVTDLDGNIYKTVIIGNQTWMAENLKTTKYNDGTAIPLVTDDNTWRSLTTPGYCWYDNDATAYKATYGALYNWHTVNTGKLCPTGWHVATTAEWTTLTTFLSGIDNDGGKLKETGTSHWKWPNVGATNESGFTALPGGSRLSGNSLAFFDDIGESGNWWTSTEIDVSNARFRNINYSFPDIYSPTYFKSGGKSVRCIKD